MNQSSSVAMTVSLPDTAQDNSNYQYRTVLPDGLDQLPSMEVLFTVIPAVVNRAKVCTRA